MLVLSRKRGESVTLFVGEVAIQVSVVEVDRGKIRLGFQADKDAVAIWRTELLENNEAKDARNG